MLHYQIMVLENKVCYVIRLWYWKMKLSSMLSDYGITDYGMGERWATLSDYCLEKVKLELCYQIMVWKN